MFQDCPKQIALLFVIPSALLLVGCSSPKPFSKHTSSLKKQKITKSKKTSAPMTTVSGVLNEFNYYDGWKGNRDPFQPHGMKRVKKKTTSGPIVSERIRKLKSALERYELGQLRVVALVTSTANPMALVKDPMGNGYVVSAGTYIGRKNGRITRINSSGLEVTTYVSHTIRGEIPRRVLLPLKSTKREVQNGSFVFRGERFTLSGNGQLIKALPDTRNQ